MTATILFAPPMGSMLEIIPSQGERAPQQMKDPGIRHLAISVDNFDAALAELRNRGVQSAH